MAQTSTPTTKLIASVTDACVAFLAESGSSTELYRAAVRVVAAHRGGSDMTAAVAELEGVIKRLEGGE